MLPGFVLLPLHAQGLLLHAQGLLISGLHTVYLSS